ncbi:alpha/beta hydrolase fold domain-containing protein [Novosphingobium sp. FGD1]|uniref:Alpha/beta hydrolase fold domain-containing protein n=1 Tax=Novosphingobium silvae TaxID=2692619 RepID=A0A7X4K9R5_9SPHN|nr:alpha/beta hydrolase [Novosphingobium silvae]MYL99653.1 alpha/beta hydrolase fold domain-containing protein [Novosphingobium silvae]
MRYSLLAGAILSIGCATGALAQSTTSVNAPPPPVAKPAAGSAAAQPPAPASDMQAVLTALAAMLPKPIETLTPVKARIQPTAADAAKAVMRARGLSTAPDPAVKTRDIPYGQDPWQFARIYEPVQSSDRPRPVIVYYHGGGWVIADVNVYDAAPRLLAKQLNAIVVSVEYRHAPEAKFPAQHEDAATAYGWVLANAASWGGDTKRVAIAGESAGGNLAVATAIHARDSGLPMPVHILSVYPIANSSRTLPSRMDSANAKPLNTPMLDWFAHYYSRTKADAQDPRINLVAANLRGLPAVTIVNARIDPLRSDGETLAGALRSSGVKVEQRTFEGVTHEFFGMGAIVRGAYDANQYAIARLKSAFKN